MENRKNKPQKDLSKKASSFSIETGRFFNLCVYCYKITSTLPQTPQSISPPSNFHHNP
jgi:hypothetical protein